MPATAAAAQGGRHIPCAVPMIQSALQSEPLRTAQRSVPATVARVAES
ncbi:MAG: hypothetical protein ACKN85_07340 [Pirellula sp.]